MESKNRTNEEISRDIEQKLNLIRPYLNSEGGDVRFIDFNEGIVRVSMIGACASCGMLDDTLTYGITEFLLEQVPEVVDVINIPAEDDLL